ncbi:hypothetical protein [Arsenophonus endosymbiont of Bemisia tabaci]|uniref:hypothetical protein n=1 Tax=Arsenophonus endosymbiont of Bemisia tabaci TaxID=536059 RepID=UPI0015F45AC9|nr:hypothetical protein [Arsenophonus endosymbiont of Bemisia tabaci]
MGHPSPYPSTSKNSVIMMDNATFHKNRVFNKSLIDAGRYGGIFAYLFVRS